MISQILESDVRPRKIILHGDWNQGRYKSVKLKKTIINSGAVLMWWLTNCLTRKNEKIQQYDPIGYHRTVKTGSKCKAVFTLKFQADDELCYETSKLFSLFSKTISLASIKYKKTLNCAICSALYVWPLPAVYFKM